MSEQYYSPVTSSQLSDAFPELKRFILANYNHTITAKRGSAIPHANSDELLYLAAGKVKAYIFDENGHEQLMYIFIKDTIIFHSISDQFCKNLVALEAASIYSVKYDDIFNFLQHDADYIRKFAQLIAARYGILLKQILTTNHQSAKNKVCSFLLDLARQFGQQQSDGSILIAKFPTLTDLAATTNVHRSNVTAYINELEALGIITRSQRQLIINDLPALETQQKKTSAP